jgi:hypothetical protein
MEEPTNDTVISAHKRSKILFYAAIAGTICTFLSTGAFLIGTGELRQSLVQGRDNDANLLNLSKANLARITSIEIGNEKKAVVDSVFRDDYKKDKEENKTSNRNIEARLTRIEWKLNLPPIDLRNDNYPKSDSLKPLGEQTAKKHRQNG